MPEVKIVDLKQVGDISKKLVIISSPLSTAIEQTLKSGSGILIMLNRRGFSTHIKCYECQHTFFCPSCAVSLTFHQSEQKMTCHYCNYHTDIPEKCPGCKSKLFKFSGVGTEKVESEIARLFPNARVARLDTDTTRKRGAHERILKQFRARQIDILVGTQTLTKGYHFPNVELVGVLWGDLNLHFPTYTARETTLQQLIQVAGRAGRQSNSTATVIVQVMDDSSFFENLDGFIPGDPWQFRHGSALQKW